MSQGFHRPQRERVLSESLPTAKPIRKSNDLQMALIIASVWMGIPSASRYTVLVAGTIRRAMALKGNLGKEYAALVAQLSLSSALGGPCTGGYSSDGWRPSFERLLATSEGHMGETLWGPVWRRAGAVWFLLGARGASSFAVCKGGSGADRSRSGGRISVMGPGQIARRCAHAKA